MTRKVIVWNVVTLDGYFEGPKPWEIDWHEYVWGEELERFSLDQAQEVGALLFGFGSANLTGSLTKQGLIDEYRIGLNPLVLGGGTPMFKPSDERMRLKLLEAQPMQSGIVLLRYARA